MNKIHYSFFLGFALASTSLSIFASSYDKEIDRNDQSIPVAGSLITPILKFKQGYDTNVTSAKNNEISSWYTIFQPSVNLTNEFGEFGKHNFAVECKVRSGVEL